MLVIGRNTIGHKSGTDFVQLAMPSLADEVRAQSDRLINLGVRVRFMLAFVPSPARKAAQFWREHMFHVDSETVFHCRLQRMSPYLWARSDSCQKVFHRVPVDAHVGMVLVT